MYDYPCERGKERNKTILNETLLPFVCSITPTACHPRYVTS